MVGLGNEGYPAYDELVRRARASRQLVPARRARVVVQPAMKPPPRTLIARAQTAPQALLPWSMSTLAPLQSPLPTPSRTAQWTPLTPMPQSTGQPRSLTLQSRQAAASGRWETHSPTGRPVFKRREHRPWPIPDLESTWQGEHLAHTQSSSNALPEELPAVQNAFRVMGQERTDVEEADLDQHPGHEAEAWCEWAESVGLLSPEVLSTVSEPRPSVRQAPAATVAEGDPELAELEAWRARMAREAISIKELMKEGERRKAHHESIMRDNRRHAAFLEV